jgi:hypothetical protein
MRARFESEPGDIRHIHHPVAEVASQNPWSLSSWLATPKRKGHCPLRTEGCWSLGGSTGGSLRRHDRHQQPPRRETARTDADFFARAGCEIRGVYEMETKALAAGKPLPEVLRLIEYRYGNVPAFRGARMPEFGIARNEGGHSRWDQNAPDRNKVSLHRAVCCPAAVRMIRSPTLRQLR